MADQPIHPISALSPFMGAGRQQIRARVSDKSDIRTWNKPNSSGKLFSCVLNDESCSIRATFFNQGVDNWHSQLNNGQVYKFAGFTVKNANKAFSNVNNDYELTMDEKTDIQPCTEQTAAIPMQRYNFIPVQVLKNKDKNTLVDVLVVVKSVGERSTIQTKKGVDMNKQQVQLCDSTGAVDLALWNDDCDKFPTTAAPGTVIALKNLRKSDWDTHSLSWSMSAVAQVNPQATDAETLRMWWANTGGNNVESISQRAERTGDGTASGHFHGRQYLSAIEKNFYGKGEKADGFEAMVWVTKLKYEGTHYYESCPNEDCKKKVVKNEADGTFRCEKCDKTYTHSKPRYMVSCEISDRISSRWGTMFHEAATAFFGIQSEEFKARESEPNFVQALVKDKIHRPYLCKLRVKEESYQNANSEHTDRMKTTIDKIEPIIKPSETEGKQHPKFAQEMQNMIHACNAYN